MVCSSLTIYRTYDMALVKKLWTDPRIYNAMADDGCPKNPEDWQPVQSSHRYFLVAYKDNIPMGIIAYYALSVAMYDVHIGLLPEFHHQGTKEIGIKANTWIFKNTDCLKILAFIPENRMTIYHLALKCGFKQEGYLKDSFLSKRTVKNQYLLTLGREDHVRTFWRC